jgi:NADH-quinone oxidoreductase subunit F
VTEGLDRLLAADATPEDIEVMAYRLRTVTDGNRCYLPVQEQRVIGSVLANCVDEINDALDGAAPTLRGLEVPKLTDL